MLKIVMSLAAMMMVLGSTAYAHHMDMMDKELTKEERATLADHFEKSAACLRSEKTMKECREEMEKHCKEAGDKCPLNKMHEHGKMHDHEKMKSDTTDKK